MNPLRLSRGAAAFLIATPLAWAALLLFHPLGSGQVYDALRDQVTRWQIVHIGTLFFIGLMGVAVFLLVRDLPGRAARLSRFAAGTFVVFYGAWEAVAGLAVGALAQHTNGLPAGERAVGSDAIQSLYESPIVGDFGLLNALGSLGWITAVLAAAVAVRQAGARRSAVALLAISALAVQHPPPVGPIALACFAGAVALIYRGSSLRAQSTA
jgi:hypothetical protein